MISQILKYGSINNWTPGMLCHPQEELLRPYTAC